MVKINTASQGTQPLSGQAAQQQRSKTAQQQQQKQH
jgi:hypothetical protein